SAYSSITIGASAAPSVLPSAAYGRGGDVGILTVGSGRDPKTMRSTTLPTAVPAINQMERVRFRARRRRIFSLGIVEGPPGVTRVPRGNIWKIGGDARHACHLKKTLVEVAQSPE